jgi:hypothetical protein
MVHLINLHILENYPRPFICLLSLGHMMELTLAQYVLSIVGALFVL